MRLGEVLDRTLSALDALGYRAAVLGGFGISAWVDPRFTRDVDLAVAVDSDEEAEALVHRLRAEGFTLLASVEQKATGRLATVRLAPPSEPEGGIVVDLLFASSGIENDVVRDAATIDLGLGRAVPVARPGHLVALKLLANDPKTRPQDALDLRALRTVLDEREVERSREACREIVARGYARGRDLMALLDEYLDDRG